MVKCIKVPKNEGNPARIATKEKGILNVNFKIKSDDEFVYIPITGTCKKYDIVDCELEEIIHEETDYRMCFSEEIREKLPSSFDCVGDIIIIKIPHEIENLQNNIGEALLKVNKNVRLILADKGVKGELRIRDLKPIAGKGVTETKHKESGVILVTDPSKVYFNPRLATERMRITNLVKDGEVIIDMFAGVAPFGIVISKYKNPKKIYSIDLNPDAVNYMEVNMNINRAFSIEPIEGDAREILKELPEADRVLMNLPQIAYEFLEDALSKTKKGGYVHLYRIMEKDYFDETVKQMIDEMNVKGLKCQMVEIKELKTYSPSSSVYVIDIVRN